MGLTGQILALVQQYEAAAKQSSVTWSQLETLRIQQQVAEIDYRLGTDTTRQLSALNQQRQRLEYQLFQQQVAQEKAKQRVMVLTGGFETSTPEPSVSEEEVEADEE